MGDDGRIHGLARRALDKSDGLAELGAMEYRELAPAPPLAAIVRCYWLLAGSASAVGGMDSPAEAALPDGSPELIFNLADPFEEVDAGGVGRPQPPIMLVGQITRPMVVRPTAGIDMVAVRFEAHGASLLHDRLQQLTGRSIDAATLLDGALVPVAAALAEATSIERRVALLDDALMRLATRRPLPDPRVAAAVRCIRACHGAVDVDAVARDHALSPRSLQRLFGAQVGITPKLLARIVRFQRVFVAWRDDPRSLARVAAECGYYDQSHLVRDFRDFAGAPPAGFLAALPEFTAFFTS